MFETQCKCVADHNPNPMNDNKHHIVPLSWQRQAGIELLAEDNTVMLCPTAHENVHTLLNAYVRNNGVPPKWEVLQHYSPFVRRLAERAVAWWGEHASDEKPPFTATHP